MIPLITHVEFNGTRPTGLVCQYGGYSFVLDVPSAIKLHRAIELFTSQVGRANAADVIGERFDGVNVPEYVKDEVGTQLAAELVKLDAGEAA